MPTFTYEAMNSVGQPVKGTVEATNSDEAIAKVRAQGNFPTKIKEKAARRGGGGGQRKTASAGAAAQPRRAKRGGGGRAPTKLISLFTRQLSTLVSAGLPIVRSLQILEEQQKPGPMRVTVRLVKEDVTEGASLSEAMKRHPKTFNALYTNMIRAGELGGVLDIILERLSEFMEKADALKRKVKGAMIYPIAVISFALLIVTGLMILVVPQFEKIFAQQGKALPAVTQMLMETSRWIKGGGWAVIILAPIGLIFGIKLLKRTESTAIYVDRVMMRIPIMGQIISKTAVARFSRTLGTLLTAGVPILEALDITADTSGNAVYREAMTKVHNAIREGESFATPLRQAKVVDSMVVNMIDVGEETGELDNMLTKIADTYDSEVETLVSSLTSLMEPVMVIVLGLIVGFIVIALFMPMIGMLDNMS
ncbi:MAG: type II secretion system F family protein [Phycisphaerae bacterium]|jgi:type IV pilus assembly protein PilC|nr:type II secretion system F family protein [Phycisphaerae bacterium]